MSHHRNQHVEKKASHAIYDTTTYSATTISTFDVVASYIVDIYYNELYGQAIKWKNAGKVPSVTEGYKHTVAMFLSAMNSTSKKDKIKYYEDVLNGIKEYFTLYTSFATLTISDCINKITCEFIPSDYFKELTKDQQRSILKNSLNTVIREFSKKVIKDYIRQIIDDHEESANILLLKECIVDLLINERETYYHRFLDSSSGKQQETIDKSLAVKMQQEIKKLNSEKASLVLQINELSQLNAEHVLHLKQLISKYKSLDFKYKSAQSEYDAKLKRVSQQQLVQKPYVQPAQPTHPVQQTHPVQTLAKPLVVKQQAQQAQLVVKQQAQQVQPVHPVTKPNAKKAKPPVPIPVRTPSPQPDIILETEVDLAALALEQEQQSQLAEPRLIFKDSDDDDDDESFNIDTGPQRLSTAISMLKNDLGDAPSISDIY